MDHQVANRPTWKQEVAQQENIVSNERDEQDIIPSALRHKDEGTKATRTPRNLPEGHSFHPCRGRQPVEQQQFRVWEQSYP